MGSCFLAHGLRHQEGHFNSNVSGTVASLNLVGSSLLIVSTVLAIVAGNGDNRSDHPRSLDVSRSIALILLSLYFVYLLFALRTHRDVYEGEEPGFGESIYDKLDLGEDMPSGYRTNDHSPARSISDERDAGAHTLLGPKAASAWLVISLIFIARCTLWLISNIQGSIWTKHRVFLEFMLFPFLGNIDDYVDACFVAWDDKMDITIRVTLGSSMQIMLFTLPFQVILEWAIGQDMTFQLHAFETAAIFLGVYIVTSLISNGKSNFLDGATCIAL